MTELDPRPWVYIYNKNTRYKCVDEVSRNKIVFDPRPGYEQDESKYL